MSGSNIANHAWENNHAIDFEGATVIDKGNYRVRKTLESWHTAKTVGADNIHALIFFTFVKGYSIIAESSYFKTFLTRERFLPFFTITELIL